MRNGIRTHMVVEDRPNATTALCELLILLDPAYTGDLGEANLPKHCDDLAARARRDGAKIREHPGPS
jgi:hypothetical protein